MGGLPTVLGFNNTRAVGGAICCSSMNKYPCTKKRLSLRNE